MPVAAVFGNEARKFQILDQMIQKVFRFGHAFLHKQDRSTADILLDEQVGPGDHQVISVIFSLYSL